MLTTEFAKENHHTNDFKEESSQECVINYISTLKDNFRFIMAMPARAPMLYLIFYRDGAFILQVGDLLCVIN